MVIKTVLARQIFDSRGNPTVEVDVSLQDGSHGRAAVPSGASTGSHEAHELRDGARAYGGLGVSRAVANVNKQIAELLVGQEADDQQRIDKFLIKLDGSEDKSHLGANAILGASLAVAKAAAASSGLPLYRYLGQLHGNDQFQLPQPMINVINGGQHAGNSTDIQEFMLLPNFDQDLARNLQAASETFHKLKQLLADRQLPTTVGDEGGFAPGGIDNQQALELLVSAIDQAGYQPGHDISIGLDVAASEFYSDGSYQLSSDSDSLNGQQLSDWLIEIAEQYPISSIEDPLAEDAWGDWTKLTSRAKQLQIVGDDLLVTSTRRLQRAIDTAACNAILIKPNQIGTLSQTLEAIALAQSNDINVIISHRSGETEDTFISHLAVGVDAQQIKAGSISRGERTAKYNELLRIAEQLA